MSVYMNILTRNALISFFGACILWPVYIRQEPTNTPFGETSAPTYTSTHFHIHFHIEDPFIHEPTSRKKVSPRSPSPSPPRRKQRQHQHRHGNGNFHRRTSRVSNGCGCRCRSWRCRRIRFFALVFVLVDELASLAFRRGSLCLRRILGVSKRPLFFQNTVSRKSRT